LEDPSVSSPLPFRVRDDFLSPAEYSFFRVLKSMMGDYLTICPKVSLQEIFFVLKPNENMPAYNRINRKHVDFLLCDPRTMKPRFAIELDDSSHERRDRIERDEFVNRVFQEAGLPLLHIPSQHAYDTAELGQLFRHILVPPASGSATGQPADTTEVNSTSASIQSASPEPHPQNAPNCPKCGQPMVLRVSQQGKNVGQKFWGCVNFPKCRRTLPFELVQDPI